MCNCFNERQGVSFPDKKQKEEGISFSMEKAQSLLMSLLFHLLSVEIRVS